MLKVTRSGKISYIFCPNSSCTLQQKVRDTPNPLSRLAGLSFHAGRGGIFSFSVLSLSNLFTPHSVQQLSIHCLAANCKFHYTFVKCILTVLCIEGKSVSDENEQGTEEGNSPLFQCPIPFFSCVCSPSIHLRHETDGRTIEA